MVKDCAKCKHAQTKPQCKKLTEALNKVPDVLFLPEHIAWYMKVIAENCKDFEEVDAE